MSNKNVPTKDMLSFLFYNNNKMFSHKNVPKKDMLSFLTGFNITERFKTLVFGIFNIKVKELIYFIIKKLNNSYIVYLNYNNNKMFSRKNVPKKNMQSFLTGFNITERFKTSVFGIFNKKVKELKIEEIQEIQLPKIIVIGNESSGKSSLIENLTKCPLFPIDKKRCTKTPIKLELINCEIEHYEIIYKDDVQKIQKHEILNRITNIMNGIIKISNDEIHVKVYHPEVVNNIFYDLPGIIEFPEEDRIASKALVTKYINEPDTLIMVVIPATCTRLTSNQALGMVIDAKKIENCILVLTMPDLINNEDDIDDLLVKRLLLTSDEIININIKKIIAVINNNNIDENKWFNDNIFSKLNNGYKKEKKIINNNITINNLLLLIDNMYHDHICTNWKTTTIEKIKSRIITIENKIKELGDKHLTLDEIMKYIYDKINWDYMIGSIFEQMDLPKIIESTDYKKINIEYSKLITFGNTDFKLIIFEAIKKIINDIFLIDEDKYKLYRFKNLNLYLLKRINDFIEDEIKEIHSWLSVEINKLRYNMINSNQIIPLFDMLMMNICRHIIDKLNNTDFIDAAKFYSNEKILDESDKYKLIRSKLYMDLKQTNKALFDITTIEKIFV
jgi:hypothetical protein